MAAERGTRGDLPTPALTVDLAALESNIAEMASWARERGLALRPHAKTHKSNEIARRQLEAGAVGICCAKLGEAEALASEGIGPILVTSPVVAPNAIARLAALNAASEGLMVVVDHPDNVDALAAAVSRPLQVLIDIDPGFHRTGVASPAAAVELAQRIAARPSLSYRGVQFYCGPQQHIEGFDRRSQAVREATRYLGTVLQALDSAGAAAEIVTGGGTGTCLIDAELGVLNELQVGSYVFLDREYLDCGIVRDGGPRLRPALTIDTRVVSANTPGLVTVDAGLKAMSTETGPPRIIAGADERSRFVFMGDEHGAILTPEGEPDPRLGQRIVLMPPHCDPTVNLYDRYAVCQGEELVDFWPVTARGRSA